MSIYAISDLHLPIGINKPMDVFGAKWENYIERLFENWNETVKDEDTVLVGGDVSWATYLEEAIPDFSFIERLNGKKIISKGNHDYWWESITKLGEFKEEHGFKSISFLHNNSFFVEDKIICGTRGYVCPTGEGGEDKIYKRELNRLENSLKSCLNSEKKDIIVMLHYPPFANGYDFDRGFMEIFKKYEVKTVLYGHLHGNLHKTALVGNFYDIDFRLVSSDYLGFKPQKIF